MIGSGCVLHVLHVLILTVYFILQDGLSPDYDPQYALRLCLERSLDGACVYIYSAMGLYEESVSLALKVYL